MEHYKWKVAWLRMDGMHAVRVFKAVIKIQKVVRGHISRRAMNRSQEDGIGAIELAVKNAVQNGMQSLQDKLGLQGGAGAAGGSANTELLVPLFSSAFTRTELLAAATSLPGPQHPPRPLTLWVAPR